MRKTVRIQLVISIHNRAQLKRILKSVSQEGLCYVIKELK